MADDSDPPRKFYTFRPREFERANQPRPELPAEVKPTSAPAEPDASKPILLHEVIAQAASPGPVLPTAPRTGAVNDVHGLLRHNLERENAAGLNTLAPKPQYRSRRRRDYLVLMISVNTVLGGMAVHALHTGNVVTFVSSIAGMGLLSAAITWVLWFVMDKY
jgi:hypothetical protein